MKLIVCIDNKNGMMFGGRRQTKDSVVIEKIADITNGCKVYTTAYSVPLLKGCDAVVCDNLFEQGTNDFVFCENFEIELSNVSEIYVFCYNRKYPADKFFNRDLKQFQKISKTEFAGNSHPKITLTQYKKDLS